MIIHLNKQMKINYFSFFYIECYYKNINATYLYLSISSAMICYNIVPSVKAVTIKEIVTYYLCV